MSEVERLLETAHEVDRGRLRGLGDDDVDALRRIASGEQRHPSRRRAVAMYGQVAGREAVPALGEVLRSRREDGLTRAAAAASLARIGGDEVEAMLGDAARGERDAQVRLHLVSALTKVATARSADVLAALARDDDETVRRQVDFARLLVAHRDGGRSVEPVAPAPGDRVDVGGDVFDFDWEPASEEEVALVVDALAGDTYGVDVDGALGYRLDCPPSHFMVLLDAAHAAAGLADVAIRRPALAGLVAQPSPVGPAWSTRWLVLVGPEGDEGEGYLALYRPDGVLAFRGGGRVSGGRASFSLGTHDAPGNVVVDVAGTATGRDVDLQRRTTTGRIGRRREPVPFDMPDGRPS